MTKGPRNPGDRELQAIGTIMKSLQALDGESIQRVLDYVFKRLSISPPLRDVPYTFAGTQPVLTHLWPHVSEDQKKTIRDLTEQKQPESSNQMAALVAYYLSEIAGGDERKDAINAADLEKYFKQAGFRLPKSIPQTLPNATAAGYFEAMGNGLYKLNPVGYNLVAHGMPRPHKSVTGGGGSRKKRLGHGSRKGRE